MKTILRKRFLSLTLAAALAVSVALPTRKSEALIGVPFGIVAGCVLGGVLVLNVTHALIRISDPLTTEKKHFIIFGSSTGAVGFIIGIILLDGAEGGITFTPMNTAQAAQMGLSTAEHEAYDAELEQINSTAQTITQKLYSEATEQQLNETQMDRRSAELWLEEANSLSVEALMAIQKISHKAFSPQT